jgi:hypothetical protein
MKLQANHHRSDKEYTVGDQVYLKLQPYVQSFMVNHPYPKLAFKLFGPYKILERVGTRAYKLALPASTAIHPVTWVCSLSTHGLVYRVRSIVEVDQNKNSKIDLKTKKGNFNMYSTDTSRRHPFSTKVCVVLICLSFQREHSPLSVLRRFVCTVVLYFCLLGR